MRRKQNKTGSVAYPGTPESFQKYLDLEVAKADSLFQRGILKDE